jgi:CrcB protein
MDNFSYICNRIFKQSTMLKELLWVGAGSCLGGMARYGVSLLLRSASGGFPWGTFVVNVAGCLLIGLLWGWSSRQGSMPASVNLFLSVGLCGGFTTFSTFSKESLSFLQSSQLSSFLLYVLLSLLLGIAAVALGWRIGHSVAPLF